MSCCLTTVGMLNSCSSSTCSVKLNLVCIFKVLKERDFKAYCQLCFANGEIFYFPFTRVVIRVGIFTGKVQALFQGRQ